MNFDWFMSSILIISSFVDFAMLGLGSRDLLLFFKISQPFVACGPPLHFYIKISHLIQPFYCRKILFTSFSHDLQKFGMVYVEKPIS